MEYITLWTRQVPDVLKQLQETGCYTVDEAYIRAKNDTIADFYLDIYRWFTKKSRAYIDIPPELDYPIWLSVSDEYMLQLAENTVILKLKIPAEKVLLVDMRKWDLRSNYMYIPVNRADQAKHDKELLLNGISDDSVLIQSDKGNFYPLLKQKIVKSWDRIFTMPAEDPLHVAATTWELKSEWLIYSE